MTNKTEKQIQEEAYWECEYSGDIELGRAKLRIKELEQELISFNHLKSISWNLNRIANVLEEVTKPKKNMGEYITSGEYLKDKKAGKFDEGVTAPDEVGFARAIDRMNTDEPVASSIRDMLKKKRKQSFEESSYE